MLSVLARVELLFWNSANVKKRRQGCQRSLGAARSQLLSLCVYIASVKEGEKLRWLVIQTVPPFGWDLVEVGTCGRGEVHIIDKQRTGIMNLTQTQGPASSIKSFSRARSRPRTQNMSLCVLGAGGGWGCILLHPFSFLDATLQRRRQTST